jgi:hypothetical protein
MEGKQLNSSESSETADVDQLQLEEEFEAVMQRCRAKLQLAMEAAG